MEPPVVNKPKINITPKITKISSLAQSAEEIKRTSTKLRKTFESGAYQKKTQLTVLNRYKKRLDTIQKQNDKRFEKKQRVKIKLPEIKKFAGSFFSAGSDPLKSIGALAAFNALRKGAKGDVLGAIGPALVASGIFLGPGLLKGGIGLSKGRGINPKSQTPPQIGASGASAGSFWGRPYSQTAAGKSYTSMQKFRTLPKWAQGMSSSSASRYNESFARNVQGTANIGDKLRLGSRGIGMQGIGGAAETIATSRPSISPRVGLLNAALFGLDFMGRKGEGQTNFQAGVGAGAGLSGALLGAAIGSALFPGVGTFAGFLIGAALSTGGAMLGSAIADKLTGVDKLQKQTEQQKKLVERKENKTLTFGKSLNRYERVVNKFDEFSKSFAGGMGMTTEQVRQTAATIEDLGGGSEPISAAGYEFTNQSSFSQYLTGDVNAPKGAYDPSHGTVDNYHDHFAFKDADTARRAAEFLQSKGIIVTELGVSSGHTAGSAHYEGRAFDVPGHQWGGSGAIGPKEYAGSAKVRAFMNDFYNLQTGRPHRAQQPMSSVFQKPQSSQGLSIGPGGFNIGGRSIATPRVSTSSRPSRSIGQYTSYDPRGQMEQVIPVAIPISQQQMMQGGGSESMMLPGPSEQDLLNSFYKRVLLNTVA